MSAEHNGRERSQFGFGALFQALSREGSFGFLQGFREFFAKVDKPPALEKPKNDTLERLGHIYLDRVGRLRRVTTITFDYVGKVFPYTVSAEGTTPDTAIPSLWSAEVSWATGKVLSPGDTTLEEHTAATVILGIHRAFEEHGVQFAQ